MHPHHSQSIQNVTNYFQRDPEVLAVLLAGSIAHGFENPAKLSFPFNPYLLDTFVRIVLYLCKGYKA